jgi:hypothetical protein
MNNLFTYRQGFETEQLALQFAETLISGGVIQKQNNIWHVWQCNF